MAWKQWAASKRLKPGDGRELQRFRWWQLPLRSLFWLRHQALPLPPLGRAAAAADARPGLGGGTAGALRCPPSGAEPGDQHRIGVAARHRCGPEPVAAR